MHVSHHFLASAPIAAGIGLLTTPLSGAAFLAGAVLIDMDHYVWYLLSQRDYSLRRAWLFFRAKQSDKYYCVCALHTVEAILLYVAGCLVMKGPFFWFAVGCLLHMTLDVAQSAYEHGMSRRTWSLIYALISTRRDKN